MKERTLRGRARPLPATGVVVLWVIACCCRLESARGFSLRVDEQFRVENKFKQPINFIINGQEASSLKFLKTLDLARFGEQYTYIAMEWNRSPNETVDYNMYFVSDNTTVLETPRANTPLVGCVPSTNYTSFRMSLPCTGKSDEAIAFEAYLNYNITSYPYTVDNFKANLNHLECSDRQGNMTGGHVTNGSTVLSMVKICALIGGDGNEDAGLSTPELAGIIAGSVIFLVVVILLIQTIVQCQREKTRAALADARRQRIESVVTRGRYHTRIVPCSAILVGYEIGKGAFRRVCIGTVILDNVKEPVPCTIKTLKAIKAESDIDEFLVEAFMLKDFRHPNVLPLLAVALDTKNLPMVCLEHMHYGDLRTYLRKMGGSAANLVDEANTTSSTKMLLSFCTQIALGMDYLSSRSFVHRDLAARNCMLSKNLVVKIGDFGLAREIAKDSYYRAGSNRPLPVKWMSFESLTRNIFTVQSDVWAFGVVMWEIFSLGIMPYTGVGNHEMMDVLQQNIRLPPPDDCPVEVYNIMHSCWCLNPGARPTFSVLAGMLDECRERQYENIPVHKVKTEPHYVNCDPATPGSNIRQTNANGLSRCTKGTLRAPYLSLIKQRSMDTCKMMRPAQQELELTTVTETSPSDIATATNSRKGGHNKPAQNQQTLDTIAPPAIISESIINEQHYTEEPTRATAKKLSTTSASLVRCSQAAVL